MEIQPEKTLPDARFQEILRQMGEEETIHSYNPFSFILRLMYLADRLYVSNDQLLQACHVSGMPRMKFEAQLYQLYQSGYLQQEFTAAGSFYRMIGQGRKMYEDLVPKTPSEPEPEKREVSNKLIELRGKLTDAEQLVFLDEAILCLRSGAYRAAVVMGWNLTYDHLRRWLFKNHLVAFNAELTSRTNRHGVQLYDAVSTPADFPASESLVVEAAFKAALFDKDKKGILTSHLTQRNHYAHPSSARATAPFAAGFIAHLLENILLDKHFSL